MKANLSDVTKALDAPLPNTRLILLYGPDEAGSATLAKRLERAMGAQAERIDLDNATLRADPARLADEAASLSLFGDKRHIRISPAGEEAVPAIEALLAAEVCENPVVAISGALKPSSALLKLVLASPSALAFASYVPDARQAEAIAIELAREVGLRLPSESARDLVAVTASDRSLMFRELEKIALYLDAAPDRPADVTRDALEAIGAAINDSALSDLTEAVMGGRPDKAGDAIARLTEDGIVGVAMLRTLQKRVALLAEMRAEVESSGRSPSQVIEARGKAIFFREKPALTRELSRWNAMQLATAADRFLTAERAIKSSGNAGDVVAEDSMLRASRLAARMR